MSAALAVSVAYRTVGSDDDGPCGRYSGRARGNRRGVAAAAPDRPRIRYEATARIPLLEYEMSKEHVSLAAHTPDEARMAERYLSVLTDVSRVAEAVRRGDWPQLAAPP